MLVPLLANVIMWRTFMGTHQRTQQSPVPNKKYMIMWRAVIVGSRGETVDALHLSIWLIKVFVGMVLVDLSWTS